MTTKFRPIDSSLRRPLVSVCIVTYNHVAYIEDCVVSALSQHGDFDIEVLVGDDASTDGTGAVLANLSQRWPSEQLIIYRNEVNIGGSDNLRQLIAGAKGQYVAHLDGDDFWMPRKLSEQIDFLKRHPQVVAVYCNALAIDPGMRPVGLFNRELPETFDAHFLLERGNFLNHSSFCYPAQTRDILLAISEPLFDYRMHLQVARSGQVGYLNKVLVGYRVGVGPSMIGRTNDAVNNYSWLSAVEVAHSQEYAESAGTGLARFVADRILESLRRGDLPRVRRWLENTKSLPPPMTLFVRRRALTLVLRRALLWVVTCKWLRQSRPGLVILFDR